LIIHVYYFVVVSFLAIVWKLVSMCVGFVLVIATCFLNIGVTVNNSFYNVTKQTHKQNQNKKDLADVTAKHGIYCRCISARCVTLHQFTGKIVSASCQ
jgi:hypothetical protein